MPGEFDFFSDDAAPPPKPRPAARAEPVPLVEPAGDEDDMPPARPAGRRPRDDDRPPRGPAPKKKPSALLIAGIIVGAFVVLAGGAVGVMLAVGPRSKPTEPQAKGQPVAPPVRPADPAAKKDAGDPDHPSKEVVDRVKKASVYVRVAYKKGKGATGSGFVEKNSRLVVTNAHVVGMLDEKDGGPKAIELVFNSGEGDNEYHYGGEMVAYDREHDLALIRPFLLDVGARQAVPDGLTVPKEPGLSLLQKVFVFGYPLGERLGSEITVSETSVSSLRKDPATGKMRQIQVKGGMNHGNSGGPVVDVKGNVIGVAVAGIDGTDINFAIPGEVVQEFIAKNHK